MPTILRAIASLAVLLFSSLGFAQTLSLTFDDGLNPDRQAQAQVWNQQIITSLTDSGITAMVFPSLIRIGGDRGMGLVMDWAKAGHAVGNHTATHRSLASAETTLDEFIADVKKADAALRHIPTWVPMLRFPYLKEGDTEEKREGIRSWMKSNGYRPAPVSIDASDWYYNQIYSSLLGSGSHDKAVRVKMAYIEHLLDRAIYYEGLAKQVLGRSPVHVMLLHTNTINAYFLDDVIAALRDAGWTIVPPAQAFADSIYQEAPDVLPAGESLVWSLAKKQGVKGLRYPAESDVYEKPKLDALGL